MLNLNELESKWLRYKVKSYIPHFIVIMSLIVILIIIFLVSSNITEQTNNKTQKTLLIKDNTIQKNMPIKKINIINEKETKQIIKKDENKVTQSKSKELSLASNNNLQSDKLVIQPSLDFIRTMQNDSPAYYDNDSKVEVIVHKEKIVQTIISPKIEEVVLDTHVEESKAHEITIQRQNTQEDIQHVIKRFKQSNNPALSLFIAKKYYELENYNQAYNYALVTNGINNDIEESWIIFAKSLYMLDKKEKAMEILQKYISSSHSHKAKILLDNMKYGKLK